MNFAFVANITTFNIMLTKYQIFNINQKEPIINSWLCHWM